MICLDSTTFIQELHDRFPHSINLLMLFVDAAPAQFTPDAKKTSTCQICFDRFVQVKIATRICGRSCRAAVCRGCLNEYIRVQTDSLPMGVLAKLKCPICIRPVNLLRWKARCPSLAHQVDAFAERVGASCSILCPSCHSSCNLLPQAAPQTDTITMKTSLVENIPLLRQRCREFCQHEATLDDLCRFVQDTFPDDYDGLMKRVVPLIHDTERRATLFLRLTRDRPFVQTSCCSADICFVCQTSGHHEGMPCKDRLPEVDDVAACPACKLTLAKGDGCDLVTCFCGFSFYWTHQVDLYRWNQLPRQYIEALAAVFRPFVYFRRLRKHIAPAVRRHPHICKYKQQLLKVCEYLRGAAHGRRFQRLVLPQIKRQVIMLDIARQKPHMLVVLAYLKRRMWQRRFMNNVLQSNAFRDEIVRRRAKHSVKMVQTHPWLKVPLALVVDFMRLLVVKARKQLSLMAMMNQLAWKRRSLDMTDEERAEIEAEKMSYMTMCLEDDDVDGSDY
ncbi:unnamed protein product [Aphanomyces euteiches]